MKHNIIAWLLILVPIASYSQDLSSKTNELGINLSGTTFGVRYKTGKENCPFRFTLMSISGSSFRIKTSDGTIDKYNTQGVGFNFGIEKRKKIFENVDIYFGSDAISAFDRSITKYTDSQNRILDSHYSFGVGIFLGFNYKINNKINVSGEVMPSLSYGYSKNLSEYNGSSYETTSHGFDYGLNTKGINLTLSFNL